MYKSKREQHEISVKIQTKIPKHLYVRAKTEAFERSIVRGVRTPGTPGIGPVIADALSAYFSTRKGKRDAAA